VVDVRADWKEWLDSALFALMEARTEDQKKGWIYSEEQLAMAIIELLEKGGASPRAIRKALWQMRHLIHTTLKLLYARYREGFPRFNI